MKIVDVEALYLRLPVIDETRTDSSQDALIIKISTDWGLLAGAKWTAVRQLRKPLLRRRYLTPK